MPLYAWRTCYAHRRKVVSGGAHPLLVHLTHTGHRDGVRKCRHGRPLPPNNAALRHHNVVAWIRAAQGFTAIGYGATLGRYRWAPYKVARSRILKTCPCIRQSLLRPMLTHRRVEILPRSPRIRPTRRGSIDIVHRRPGRRGLTKLIGRIPVRCCKSRGQPNSHCTCRIPVAYEGRPWYLKQEHLLAGRTFAACSPRAERNGEELARQRWLGQQVPEMTDSRQFEDLAGFALLLLDGHRRFAAVLWE